MAAYQNINDSSLVRHGDLSQDSQLSEEGDAKPENAGDSGETINIDTQEDLVTIADKPYIDQQDPQLLTLDQLQSNNK